MKSTVTNPLLRCTYLLNECFIETMKQEMWQVIGCLAERRVRKVCRKTGGKNEQ